MPQLDDLPALLTIRQASGALNCHPNTLRLWEDRGVLKSIRIGTRKDRRYRKEDILALMQTEGSDALIEKTVLPSSYDLTRIDMTGTYYEGIQSEILEEHKGYHNLNKQYIDKFDFSGFLAGYNQGIKYFDAKDLEEHPTVAEKVLAIITSPKYRSGSLETINLSKYREAIVEKLNYCVAKQEPVEFMLPAFPFKIANPLKSLRRDADLAEVGSFCKLNEMNLQIRRVYAPGARFHIFHDGHLYYRHFLHEKEDADRYFRSLERFVKGLGLEEVVLLHDVFADLQTIPQFPDIYFQARAEMTALWASQKAQNEKIQRIIQSAKANVNLSEVPYRTLWRITTLEEWDLTEEEKQVKREINERAERCAFEYMVVQHALEKADFFVSLVPHGVRLTVHPKEGHIGIYLVKRKTYLLPWMGVGVLKNNGEVSVHYESELLSSSKYYPVFLKDEKYPFYYKEAEAIYQGAEEFKRLFDAVVASLGAGDHYWAFAFHDEYMDPKATAILTGVHAHLADRGIQDRAICRSDIYPEVKKAYRDNRNIEIRAVSGEIPTGVVILKDRVINLIWGDVPAAYEVRTAEVVRRYQKLFVDLWNK